MTKAELIAIIGDKFGVPKASAAQYYDVFWESIGRALSHGERVITPIGIFRVLPRVARLGRNPKTGEKNTIPARYVIHFTASDTLKEKLASDAILTARLKGLCVRRKEE